MTTETNTTTATTPKVKTVLDDMPARALFDSIEAATAFLTAAQGDETTPGTYSDFNSYPVAFTGCTEDGDFDPAVYTDDMQIAVAKLTERGDGANSSTVKAIVIYPSPTVQAFMESAMGTAWIAAIVAKEANHVAVRNLRKAKDADDFAAAIENMPQTVADYTTAGRESSGGINEAYNDLWQIIKKAIGQQSKAFALANLSKKELRKAMESASYAAEMYPRLETITNKAGEAKSLFAVAATFGSMIAKQQGKDPAVFDKMLATRDEKTIDVADEGEEEFDLEAMAAALVATPAAEGTATDSTGEEAAAE